jgi:dTDP-4-dehydrorhamnose 3,5-epimerase
MGKMILDQIKLTKLKKIKNLDGDVFHGLKKTESSYFGVGEVYFSWINKGSIKGWKLHKEMISNLIVPFGLVKFVFYDNDGNYRDFTIGDEHYSRLTVPPNIWFGFMGIGENSSLVANIASIEHASEEVISKDLSQIQYDWK